MNGKIIIAIILIVVIGAALYVFTRKITGKQSLRESSTNAPSFSFGKTHKKETTQDRIIASDIKGNVLVQKDGTVVTFIKVSCKNNSLLNTEELVNETSATASAFSSQEKAFKIIHIQRPVDSSASLARYDELDVKYMSHINKLSALQKASLSERKQRQQFIVRRHMLSKYRSQAEREVKGGTKMKAEAYICLPCEYGVTNEDVAMQQARDFQDRLKAAGYNSEILYGEEIISFLLAYSGDYRSATENKSPYAISPLTYGVNDEDTLKYEDGYDVI